MAELFKTKVRQVGTSLGVLIPKEIVRKDSLEKGAEIEVAILKKDMRLIDEAFGSAKKARLSFKRDRKDRI